MKSSFLEAVTAAIVAGSIGGLGGYIAIKVDLAVLKNNQARMKEDLVALKDAANLPLQNQGRIDLLQFQINTMSSSRDVMLMDDMY